MQTSWLQKATKRNVNRRNPANTKEEGVLGTLSPKRLQLYILCILFLCFNKYNIIRRVCLSATTYLLFSEQLFLQTILVYRNNGLWEVQTHHHRNDLYNLHMYSYSSACAVARCSHARL